MNKKNKNPIWILVLTSLTFTIPIFILINYDVKSIDNMNNWPALLFCCSACITFISVIQWTIPNRIIIYTLDRLIARIVVSIYSVRGYIVVENSLKKLILWLFMLMCYLCSRIFRKFNKEYWIYFHILFHLSAVLGGTIIMYNEILYYKKNNKLKTCKIFI